MLKVDKMKSLFSSVGKTWRRINRPVVTSRGYRLLVILVVAIILFILMAMIIALGISSIVSEAAEIPAEEKGLPIYPKVISGSRQRVESIINEIPVTTTLFLTSDPSDKIVAFYKDKMTKRGWEIIYPVDKSKLESQGIDISKIPDINPEQGSFLALKKGDITYNIAAMKNPKSAPPPPTTPHPSPEGFATAVYINRIEGKIDCGSSTKDAPGKELTNIPRYPKSIRKMCLENLNPGMAGTTLIYESKDDLEKIVDFYQKEMAKGGWNAIPLPQSKEVETRLIFFRNREGKNCLVSIAPSKNKDSSQIVILYKEKGF